MKVRIRDNNFAHGHSSCHGRKPSHFRWDRKIYKSKVCFFTDNSLQQASNDPAEIKIGWLCEPKAINPSIYKWVVNNHHIFDYILTYDRELCKIDKKFLFYPHSGCWIDDESINVCNKTKFCSIIASNKKSTFGHKLRHKIINQLKHKIDIFGRGYNPIENKLLGLKDYKYHIVVENSKQDDYFTEKIIDSLSAGTIPIYYGTDNIDNYFNGIIKFNSVEELTEIVSSIEEDPHHYKNNIFNVESNIESIKQYKIAEDYIFQHYNSIFN